MANPFFKPAAAQPQAAPAASGPIGRIASAVQTASRVMRTMRDPSEAINAALNSQAFAGYTGPRDAHWTEADTTNVGRSIGVDFDKISPLCWWAALNMMRSDYYPTAAKFGLDRPDFYAALAHDFLLDPDAPGPEKKLKGYYYGVVEG